MSRRAQRKDTQYDRDSHSSSCLGDLLRGSRRVYRLGYGELGSLVSLPFQSLFFFIQPLCLGTGIEDLCRYADDFVCAFRYKADADRFYEALRGRLRKFGLELAEAENEPTSSQIGPNGAYALIYISVKSSVNHADGIVGGSLLIDIIDLNPFLLLSRSFHSFHDSLTFETILEVG